MIHSATAIAEKYRVDLDHARNVAEVAVRLFDLFQPDHGLGPRQRLLLRVAGLVARGGRVRQQPRPSQAQRVSDRQCGDFRAEPQRDRDGFADRPLPSPQRAHGRRIPSYMALTRESRVVVNKLAALLRVADALIRGHRRREADIHFQRQGDELIVADARRPRPAAGRAGRGDQGRSARRHLRREDPAGAVINRSSPAVTCGVELYHWRAGYVDVH